MKKMVLFSLLSCFCVSQSYAAINFSCFSRLAKKSAPVVEAPKPTCAVCEFVKKYATKKNVLIAAGLAAVCASAYATYTYFQHEGLDLLDEEVMAAEQVLENN